MERPSHADYLSPALIQSSVLKTEPPVSGPATLRRLQHGSDLVRLEDRWNALVGVQHGRHHVSREITRDVSGPVHVAQQRAQPLGIILERHAPLARRSRGDRELFRPIVDSLLGRDNYRLMGDFASYVQAQEQVSAAYADRERWTRMSILNVARMGKFSSDRSIRDYCRDIWRVQPTKIALLSEDEVTGDLLQ